MRWHENLPYDCSRTFAICHVLLVQSLRGNVAMPSEAAARGCKNFPLVSVTKRSTTTGKISGSVDCMLRRKMIKNMFSVLLVLFLVLFFSIMFNRIKAFCCGHIVDIRRSHQTVSLRPILCKSRCNAQSKETTRGGWCVSAAHQWLSLCSGTYPVALSELLRPPSRS